MIDPTFIFSLWGLVHTREKNMHFLKKCTLKKCMFFSLVWTRPEMLLLIILWYYIITIHKSSVMILHYNSQHSCCVIFVMLFWFFFCDDIVVVISSILIFHCNVLHNMAIRIIWKSTLGLNKNWMKS